MWGWFRRNPAPDHTAIINLTTRVTLTEVRQATLKRQVTKMADDFDTLNTALAGISDDVGKIGPGVDTLLQQLSDLAAGKASTNLSPDDRAKFSAALATAQSLRGTLDSIAGKVSTAQQAAPTAPAPTTDPNAPVSGTVDPNAGSGTTTGQASS